MKGFLPHRARLLIGTLVLLLPAGCASRDMVVEIHGAVMYDKPEIQAVSHVLEDRRPGGGVVVTVTLEGHPGLAAPFDITPDIVDRVSLQEVVASFAALTRAGLGIDRAATGLRSLMAVAVGAVRAPTLH